MWAQPGPNLNPYPKFLVPNFRILDLFFSSLWCACFVLLSGRVPSHHSHLFFDPSRYIASSYSLPPCIVLYSPPHPRIVLAFPSSPLHRLGLSISFLHVLTSHLFLGARAILASTLLSRESHHPILSSFRFSSALHLFLVQQESPKSLNSIQDIFLEHMTGIKGKHYFIGLALIHDKKGMQKYAIQIGLSKRGLQ